MFFSQRLPSAPDEIYSSSLDTLHLGHALWYPEPHVTGEPHIGDVGFMREGAFVRLFNLDTSAPEKEVKFWPKRFENIESLPPDVLQIDSRSCPLVPDHYCSDGVERKEMHASVDVATSVGASATLSANYTCKTAQGAVLVLQSEAHTESLFENHLLHTYIARNYDKWYAYAKDDLGQAIQQESIIVIRGWVKTTSDWAAVAFRNTTTTTKFSLKGRVGNAVGAEMGGSRTSSVRGPRMQRQGKNYSAKASGLPVPEAKRNQCPFLKRYKLRRRPGFPWKVIASAGYHVLPDSGDARGTSGMEGVVAWDQDLDEVSMLELESEGEVLDPLDILLDYILETTDVEIAIASDNQIESIVNGYRVVDFASYLRQLQPPVRVDDTLGSLCMEDVVTHERARAFAHRRITRTDLKKWSGITVDGAGLLEDWQVFIGPAETSAQPLKSKRIIFMDTQDSHSFRNCASATLSSDGTLLAASFEDGDILIWRLSDSLLVQHLHHRDLSSSTPAEAAKFLVFCSRDKTLVSCSAGCETFWDIQSGHRLESPWRNSFCRPILSVVYAPNGVLSAVSHWKGTNVTLKDGRKMSSILVHGYIRKLSFSPDILRLYIELKDSCIIFDTNTHKRIAIIQRESTRPLYCSMSYQGSYQGDRIVTASDDGKMKIWSAVTGRNLLTIKFPKILSTSVTFSPDGAEVMAACRADNTAIAYDSWTGGLRRVFQFSARAQHLLYSPNGAFVAVGTVNGDLQVFNARSGTFVAKFEGAGEGWDFKAIQFLPDSRTLLAQLSHGPLILYNIQDALRVR